MYSWHTTPAAISSSSVAITSHLTWVSLINGMEYGLECGLEWWNGMTILLFRNVRTKICSDIYVRAK